jgi:hypothetical protein
VRRKYSAPIVGSIAVLGIIAAFWRRKVIEYAKQIAVYVFSHELVQAPWL